MVTGMYVPTGTDGQILQALEKFAESLIEPMAEALWQEGDDHIHERSDEAEGLLDEALRRFVQLSDWRTYT